MNSSILMPEIVDCLNLFTGRAKKLNRINLTDNGNYAEDLFGCMLDVIFGTSLVNNNDLVANATTVDLVDRAKKISVQVTTQNTNLAAKKQETLDSFKTNLSLKDCTSLYLLYLCDAPVNKSLLKSEVIETGKTYIGLDVDSLLKKIKPLGAAKKQRILEILQEELAPLKELPPIWDKKRLSQLQAKQPQALNSKLTIDRSDVVNSLFKAATKYHQLIIGKPGIGKSSILNVFNQYCWLNKSVAVTIPVNDLLTASAHELDSLIGSGHWPFLTYLATIKSKACFLIFDAVDTAKEEHLKNQVLEWIRLALEKLPANWKIMISVRTYDAYHSQKLLRIFSRGTTEQLAKVPKFTIEPLEPDQVEAALNAVTGSSTLYQQAGSELKELLRIPYFLGIFEEVLDGATVAELAGLKAVRSEEQLLSLYWQRKVLLHSTDLDRETTLRSVTRSLFHKEKLTLSRDEITGNIHGAALQGLLSDGILVTSGLMDRQLSFVHNILYDFAITVLTLSDDPDTFMAQIRENPKAPFIFRPSYWFLLSKLWDEDRDKFWKLYYLVDGQEVSYFKIIHQVLFNAVVAFQFKSFADLTVFLNNRSHLRYGLLINKFLQSLKFTKAFQQVPDAEAIAVTITKGLRPESLSMAGFYLDTLFKEPAINRALLVQAQTNFNNYILQQRKLKPEIKGQLDWQGQRYGMSGIMHILRVSTYNWQLLIDPVLEILQEENFPMEYFMQLAHVINDLWSLVPEAADRFFRAVYLRTENSEERVAKGGVVVALNMSRAQEWAGNHHQLERWYPDYLEQDTDRALRSGLFLINKVYQSHFSNEKEKYPITMNAGPAIYRPDHSQFFEYSQYPEGTENFLKCIFDLLDTKLQAGDDISNLLDILVDTAEKGIIWRMLLRLCGEHPQKLKALSLELLSNPVLLLATETANEAIELLAVQQPFLTDEDWQQLKTIVWAINETELSIADDYLEYKLQKLKAVFEPLPPAEPEKRVGVTFTFPPIDPGSRSQSVSDQAAALLPQQQNPVLGLSFISQGDAGAAYDGIAGAKLIYEKMIAVKAWLHDTKPETNLPAYMALMQGVQKIAKLNDQIPPDIHAFCIALCLEVLQNVPGKSEFETQESAQWIPVAYANPRVEAAKAVTGLCFLQHPSLVSLIESMLADNDRKVRANGMQSLKYFYRFDTPTFWGLLQQTIIKETDGVCLQKAVQIIYVQEMITGFPTEVVETVKLIAPKVKFATPHSAYLDTYVDFVLYLLFAQRCYELITLTSELAATENFTIILIRKTFPLVDQQYQLGSSLTDTGDLQLQEMLLKIATLNLRSITAWNQEGSQWKIIHELATRMHFFVMHKQHDNVDQAAVAKYGFLKPLVACLLEESNKNSVAMMVGQTAYYVAQCFEKFIGDDPADILYYLKQLVKLSEKTGFVYDAITMKMVMSMFEVYLADHKELIMKNPHFQYILDTLELFANAGWQEAIELIWRLGEIL